MHPPPVELCSPTLDKTNRSPMLSVLPLLCGFAVRSPHTIHARGMGTRDTLAGVQLSGLPIDLKGKVAFVAGVADSSGYGWSIVKHLAPRAPLSRWARGRPCSASLRSRSNPESSTRISSFRMGRKWSAEDLPSGCDLRLPGGRAGGREDEQAVRGRGRIHDLRGG